MNTQGKKTDSQAHEIHSMSQIIWNQFIEHRMAVVGMFIIAVFVSIALLAPIISSVTGIDPDDQNIFKRYHPAFSTVEISTDNKEALIEQFVESNEDAASRLIALIKEKAIVDSSIEDEDVLFELGMEADKADLKKVWALGTPEIKQYKEIIDNFSTFHVLGTDELGRDVLMRLIYGTRVSITFGIIVAIASAFIGLVVGCLAGYYGGWIDAVFSRLIDSLLSLPLIPLMIIFAAVDLNKMPFIGDVDFGNNQSIIKLVIVVVLFSWMTVARLVRGSILSLKEQEFILAAKTLGAKDYMIIVQHIVPNVISPLLVAVTLNVGNSILYEAALSFLGLGIQPPTPSWGNMLFNAQELIFQAPLLAILPGILILLTVISFNFVGDGLQAAIDPKSIKR